MASGVLILIYGNDDADGAGVVAVRVVAVVVEVTTVDVVVVVVVVVVVEDVVVCAIVVVVVYVTTVVVDDVSVGTLQTAPVYPCAHSHDGGSSRKQLHLSRLDPSTRHR